MDWSAFRTSHLSEYGSTSREQLSRDYQKYKKSLTGKNPLTTSIRSPRKNVQSVRTSPVRKSIVTRPTSPVRQPVRNSIVTRPTSPVRQPERQTVRTLPLMQSERTVRPLRQTSPLKSQKKMTLKDIENMAEGKKFFIVVLYGDFCGHCRDMKERLGDKMKNTEKLIFVEANNMAEELKDYFPHVMYYENGERQKDLNVDNIYDYLSI